MNKCVLVVLLSVAVWSGPACAEEEGQVDLLKRKIAALEGENATLRWRVRWLEMLREVEHRYEEALDHVIVLDLSGSGVDREEERRKLAGVRLPDVPTKDDVRAYVAEVLARSAKAYQDHDDPAIEFLRRVGSDNVDVLMEPLRYVKTLNEEVYLIEALKTLLREEHKPLVFENLPLARQLVEVVVERGWTRDAAPILLRELAKRSPELRMEWIEAAASVAAPDHYDELKYYMAIQDPLQTWMAIRELEGIEPLDEWVEWAWDHHKKSPDLLGWHRRRMAIVAAHYGRLDALRALAQGLRESDIVESDNVIVLYDEDREVFKHFQQLTGYAGAVENAARWLEANEHHLVFDRSKRLFTIQRPDK